MEKKELVVCDTNILIEVIDRNNSEIIEALMWYFSEHDLCISSITYSEMLVGATNKQHRAKLLNELEKFILIPIDKEIDQIHRELIRRYSLSHKLEIQDALIAASAIQYGAKLFTLNKRDFRFINDLQTVSMH